MELSIIIVNYNVKYFLDHCLCSVQKAIKSIDAEVLVIDNNSPDNSVEYLEPLFNNVTFIKRSENLGFGKANNLGLEMAKGRYVLFLNPDTLIQEDTLHKCIAAFEQDEKIGAIGVRMIDGSGKFLKESKRSFPSPATSLFKLFGLAALFPKSPVFSKYHLGHLSEHKNHEVDVLSGAFMMVRKAVLDKTGGFDKDFFMYGEDIDLSYRIQEAGYKNLYLADTSIIHFKGESTNKGSLNYVKMFYQAMEIFVQKHYGGARKNVFIFLLHLGIRLRAFLSVVAGFIKKIGLPVIDFIVFLSCFWLAKGFWNNFIKTDTEYSGGMLWIAFSVFSVLYLVAGWLWGLYDKAGYRTKNVIYAGAFAIVVLLALYSLLPEHLRFSRGIILLGSVLGFTGILILRLFLVKTKVVQPSQKKAVNFAGLVAGSRNDYEAILKILKARSEEESFIAFTGDMQELKALQHQTQARKIIFATGSLGYKKVIKAIGEMPGNLRYRFYNTSGKTIIGSHSRDESGAAESYNKYFRLNDPFYRRMKRLFDIVSSLLLLVTFPVHLFLVKKPGALLHNIFNVLSGQKTWVGYTSSSPELIPLKPGVLFLNGVRATEKADFQSANYRLDEWYAREYSIAFDLSRLTTFYRLLGD